jgi:hypothetical protein
VTITRLFVYDPEMPAAEARERRRLMSLQIKAGIDVLVITEDQFLAHSNAENATKRIGSADFMIIDDVFVYLTFPNESDEIEAALLDGNSRRYLAELEAARGFRDLVGGWADQVTTANVAQFPGILA